MKKKTPLKQTPPQDESIKISDLKLDPDNANKGTERGGQALLDSLRKYGAGRSILIDKNGSVIAGNKTLSKAQEAGLEDVLVIKTDGSKIVAVQRTDLDLNDPKARELAYADNRISEIDLDWDIERLKKDLEKGIDLESLFSEKEINELLASLGNDAETQDAEPQIDKAEELREKWGVETGQLWQLGEHRLICGDCTDRAVVERVMGGEKYRLCFTSPPYADQRTYQIGDFDWLALMVGCTNNLFGVCGDPGDVIINLGMSYQDGRVNFYWGDWLMRCDEMGHPLYGWYVWDKGRGFPGEWNGRLGPSHEFLFHFSIGHISANKWVEKKESSFERNKYVKNVMQRNKDGSYKAPYSPDAMNNLYKIPDSVIRMPQETDTIVGNHPAVFPVEFPEFGLQTWGNSGCIVYDPFLGSGTTLIACERLGRKCRAVEISPAYCAVSIQRWVDVTGKEPKLLEG